MYKIDYDPNNVAKGLFAIASALDKLSAAVKETDPAGSIDYLAKETREGLQAIAESVDSAS